MTVIAALLFGYAVGALPFIHFLARARGLDLRSAGTGNVGSGNLWRQAGPALGIAGITMEIGKGTLPPMVVMILGWGPWSEVAAGLAAVAGQMWPVTLGFQGGRGNGTATGVLLAFSPFATFCGFAIFLLAAAPRVRSILSRRRMGPASKAVPVAVLVAMTSYAPIALFIGDTVAAVVALAVVAMILVRRITASWPPDPVTGRPPPRSLVAILLFDRPA